MQDRLKHYYKLHRCSLMVHRILKGLSPLSLQFFIVNDTDMSFRFLLWKFKIPKAGRQLTRRRIAQCVSENLVFNKNLQYPDRNCTQKKARSLINLLEHCKYLSRADVLFSIAFQLKIFSLLLLGCSHRNSCDQNTKPRCLVLSMSTHPLWTLSRLPAMPPTFQ